VNNRSATKIYLEDPAIAPRIVSGLNGIDDPELLAENLSNLYDLQITRSGNRIILGDPQK
jgi:ferric-dicitrate binding protein FerR (iron transport regulator)